MKQMIVVREIKRIYHQIEIDTDDDMAIDRIAYEIGIKDFESIDDVADYINEIVPVNAIDEYRDEVSEGFWYENDYTCE